MALMFFHCQPSMNSGKLMFSTAATIANSNVYVDCRYTVYRECSFSELDLMCNLICNVAQTMLKCKQNFRCNIFLHFFEEQIDMIKSIIHYYARSL